VQLQGLVMPSPAAASIELCADERRALEDWTRRRTSAAALSLRARIVLACAAGESNTEIARRLGVHRNTVALWRRRFLEFRLDGLTDEPRPGQPRKISDAMVEEVIAKTSDRPGSSAGTRCSSKRSATSSGSISTRPSARSFCASMRSPRSKRWIAPRRSCRCAPACPSGATHDYKRHGTSSLYAALDLSTGKVIGALHSRHRAIEFKKFLQTIDREVPDNLAVHLVLDNSSTHKTPAIKKWLLAHPRFQLHFTPTSSSWMNLAERWFGELTNKKLRRGAHRSVRALNADIRETG
jgi:transposase-like protein/transposase